MKLRNIEIFVGDGDNHFTMKRGSFKYRQKLRKMEKLKLLSEEQMGDVYRSIYLNPADKTKYALDVVTDRDSVKYTLSELDEDGEAANGSSTHNRYRISFDASESEHIYGCGENYSCIDLKGEKVRIWVAEHQNTNRIGKKLIKWKIFGSRPDKVLPFGQYESYYVQPTFVSSEKYFIHADVRTFSEFDFSERGRTTLSFQELPTLYIGEAETFEELSSQQSELLGRQRELPDWIYDGMILGAQGGTEEVDRKVRRCIDHGARICGIWAQDWCGCRRTGFGYQVMWNWEYDRELYSGLPSRIKEWENEGIHFLGYINPFIAIEKNLYKEASAKGYCVKDKEGKDYLVTITTFPAAMVDFTNPEAYEWYKKLIKENMIGIGMSGWMADFGEYLPVDSVLHSGEDPYELHNEWPAIWARMNREAIEECGVSDKVFFFTRAGYTGTIRDSAMMWTGDQHVDWSVDDGLPSCIRAAISLSMSGYGISHWDAGGYTTVMQMTRGKELLLRWEEMSAFSPLYRSHEGNQPTRNVQAWDDEEELLSHLARTSQIHAGLKDYLQNAVRDVAEKGVPVIRPLFYSYQEKELYTESTEYLLGADILVAPVIREGQVSRKVVLPDDEWTHIWSGKSYTRGTYEIDAPLGQPPVFVSKSSSYYGELMKLADIDA